VSSRKENKQTNRTHSDHLVPDDSFLVTCLYPSDRENQLCIYLRIETSLQTGGRLLHTENRTPLTEQHDSRSDRRAWSSFPSASVDVNRSFCVPEHGLSSIRPALAAGQSFANQFVEHVPLSLLQHQCLLHSYLYRCQSDMHTLFRAVDSRKTAIVTKQLACQGLLVRK
jgi:hypothetical protein